VKKKDQNWERGQTIIAPIKNMGGIAVLYRRANDRQGKQLKSKGVGGEKKKWRVL